jgi:crotonobetainyl-CoA:carnitine CoA-transferase CaiB-like acyl-CoA transferase
MANNESLQQVVRDWVGSMPRDEVLAVLDEFEVVGAAVNDSSDIVVDPHFLARTLTALSGSRLGEGALMPGPVLHVDRYSGPAYHGVPQIGEHTTEVLSALDSVNPERLALLLERGVIRQG